MQDFVKGLAISQVIPNEVFNQYAQRWNIDKGTTKLPIHKLFDVLILSAFFEQKNLRDMALSYGIPKSTLDDALAKRSCGFFEELLPVALKHLIPLLQNRKDRQDFRDLIAIDSSVISIHGSMASIFKMTRIEPKKAGMKIHVAFDVENQLIEETIITAFRNNDGKIGKLFKFKNGKTYVFDRGYVDCKLWEMIKAKGAHFVTRLKRSGDRFNYVNATVENINDVGVLHDGIWAPSQPACYAAGIERRGLYYRVVIYRDPESKKLFHFVTSDFSSKAENIALSYRKRWAVELLFRWLKGHLNMRKIAFKNRNAIHILLCVAVITQLLIRFKMLTESFAGSSWDYLRSIRFAIFKAIYEILTDHGSYDDPSLKDSPGKALMT